ncbi:MAG TPA: sulfurtransferase [Tepidiformaceae bacterium]|nr:sulfurtransferase [Tepidiformaceae bacterium]
MPYANPEYLISTSDFATKLDDPALRILDCTVYITSEGVGGGLEHYEKAHIPGAVFADLAGELSDPDSPLRFTMPSGARFAAAMSHYGVGTGTRVVCYDANMSMWAARVWWMLRAFGFEDAAVLDGGWKKWKLEGRPSSTEQGSYPSATFVARPRAGLIATKDEVLAASRSGAGCVINALTEEQHRGDSGATSYGRAGHIANSTNVSARGMLDPETGAYLPAETLSRRFADAGASQGGRVITYCGGGIAASSDALILTLLGHDDVAVYDGSLSEWARDASLPMEVG